MRTGDPKSRQVLVALLRGVNVGGKNKLPMKELAALFSDEGCLEVRTFIQSGNVVFLSPDMSVNNGADGLAERIAGKIAERFGIRTTVVLRTAAEWAGVIGANPFPVTGDDETGNDETGNDEDAVYVMFLADLPDAEGLSQLDPERSPGDRFVVRGREIFLHLKTGAAKTKLTNQYFDSRLRTVGTTRNWRTVNKLQELATTQK